MNVNIHVCINEYIDTDVNIMHEDNTAYLYAI